MEKRRRVLIADNSEEFCCKLRASVEQVSNWEVVGTALNGNDAITLMLAANPDVILLDLLLPDLDGISVLRKAAELPSPPICMVMTGFLTEYAASAAAGLGVRYFMAKPCRCESVVERLAEILKSEEQGKRQIVRRAEVNIEAMVTSVIHEIGVPGLVLP